MVNVLYYGLAAAAAVLGFKIVFGYLFPALYPFFIAYLLSLIFAPAAHFLKQRIKLPKGAGAFLLVTAAVALVFALGGLLVYRAARELGRLCDYLSALTPEDAEPLKRRILALFDRVPFVDGERLWQSAGERLRTLFTESLPGIKGTISMATSLFTGFLDFLFTFLVTAVSCYYMTVNRTAISAFFARLLPESARGRLRALRASVFGAVGKYLKAYGLIMLVTFTELFAAFTVLRLDFALLLAAATALVDILPVLGAGTVLIPWALVCLFLTRNIYLGVGLLIAYAVITVIRQVIEPKIVGSCIGVHPLATMAAMFAGLKLFGFWGMLVMPLVVLVVKSGTERDRLK